MTKFRNSAARRVCLLVVTVVLWAAHSLDAKKKPPPHPINLNTASSAELQEVPGIGPATAEKILKARKSYGAFKSVDDLESIKGIGPKRLDKMRKYLTVGKAPQAAKAATSAATTKSSPPANKPRVKSASPPKAPADGKDDEEQ